MDRKIWTASELDHLSEAEKDRIFTDGIVWNLDEAPPAVVARARAFVEDRIGGQEAQRAD